MPTEMELTLEQTQQGVSYEVSVSIEGVEEWKRNVRIKVCACARYQVNPKVSHLHAVKRIFRYLKGQPKLGLWYQKDSPFDLVVYTDSDYVEASLDRKSTIGGCQFLGCRLISWQCEKRQVVVGLEDFTTYWLLFNIGAAMKIKCMLKRLKKISKSFILLDVIVSNQLHKAKKSVKLMMENLFGMELEINLVTQVKMLGITYYAG
ncbi:hypothetical protein Tco_1245260 [Tanacetum coccineum]